MTAFVRANGLRFAYLEHGKGPLVLLLHGFPDTAHTWDHVLPEIAGVGYRAVAPFMRGYHPTEIPPHGPFDVETLGNDTLALVEALGESRAIIVGHDWGAAAAYAAAARGPDRIQLCITVGLPHPRAIKPTPRVLWILRHFFVLRRASGATRLRADDCAYVDELVRRWSPAWTDIPSSETAHVKQAFREPGCAEAACGYYRAASPRLPTALALPITMPAVAFAGEHDQVEPRRYEKARHCFTGSYEVVQVPGGHFMHREHPAVFATELVRVLRDHERRGKPG